MQDVAGKVVFISGASTGIGRRTWWSTTIFVQTQPK